MLSGFLLARPFVAARFRGNDLPSTWGFLRRRARRVLPAYWLQLIILVLVAGAGSGGLLELVTHATLSFNLIDNGSAINPVYWSLPVEWDFYLLLPLLALGFPRAGRGPWLFLGLISFGMAFRVFCWQALFWDQPSHDVFRWVIQLPARIDQFAIGMALACFLSARPVPGKRIRAALAGAGLLLLVSVASTTVHYGYELNAERLPWAYLEAPLAALGCAGLILGAALPGDGLNMLWRSRPMLFLGTISYGLYLWHSPLLGWLKGGGLPVASFIPAAVLLSLLLAWLSWRCTERPFLRS